MTTAGALTLRKISAYRLSRAVVPQTSRALFWPRFRSLNALGVEGEAGPAVVPAAREEPVELAAPAGLVAAVAPAVLAEPVGPVAEAGPAEVEAERAVGRVEAEHDRQLLIIRITR